MKKSTVIYLLLCIALISQGQNTKEKLAQGDVAPSITPFKWIRGTPVDNFKSEHIYLVEFGATWCTPCAAAIPELNKMQQDYQDKVTVISIFVMEVNDHKSDINPAYVTKVDNYVTKRSDKMNYTIAVDTPDKGIENAWLKAAGKTGIPYIFIVDGRGKIASISSHVNEGRNVIDKLLSNQEIPATSKGSTLNAPSLPYDERKLLLVDDNGGMEDDFFFRSVLTRYDGTIRAANPFAITSNRWGANDSLYNYLKDRVQLIDVSLADLYSYAYKDTLFNVPTSRNYYSLYSDTLTEPRLKTAYGKYWHLPILEVKDQTPFLVSYNNIANRFNYSLKVPHGTGTARYLQECMRKEMDIYFGYNVSVEVRPMPVWKVFVADQNRMNRSVLKGHSEAYEFSDDEEYNFYRNASMRDLIWTLGSNFGFGPYGRSTLPASEQAAFVDYTGIKDNFSFRFNRSWTFYQFQDYLKGMGIGIVKATRPMSVVVIRD